MKPCDINEMKFQAMEPTFSKFPKFILYAGHNSNSVAVPIGEIGYCSLERKEAEYFKNLIIKCVNLHDDLTDALEDVMRGITDQDNGDYYKYKTLIEKARKK